MEVPSDKVFWGLVIEQGKQYKQTPKFNFHVSMAVLDLKNADNEVVTLYVAVETGEFILCNLTKNQPQVHLDLIFSEGEKIKFYTTGGKGSVHLTGYTMPEEDMMMDEDDFSDEESVDLEDQKALALAVKRKNTETLKLNGKDNKKLKTNEGKAVEVAKPQKVVDVDVKQLMNSNKKQQSEQKKNPQQVNQQQNKKQLAVKGLEESDSDDDVSVDEDDSVDLNKLNDLMENDESDDLNDDDLESDDEDLESDDEEELNVKPNNFASKARKSNLQQNKPQAVSEQKNKSNDKQHGKPNFSNQKNASLNFGKNKQQNSFQNNKTPQNKGNQTTPFNKGQQKHQQTPFNKNQNQNSNKKQQGGSPFQHNKGNKSFGSHNKQAKKVFN